MRIKYPRTFHLPYSLTVTDDDKRLCSDDIFKSMDKVVVTIKMDGENTTCYYDGFIHARSLDGTHHEWQNMLKKNIFTWCHDIPENWRVCGENLYARHSIPYTFNDESSLFQVFGIYDDENTCLAWDETENRCRKLGLKHVPVIYVGKYDKEKILDVFNKYKLESSNEVEGFVVRNFNAFKYDDFSRNIGKFVRKNHVTTDEHWSKHWVRNEVK